MTKDGLDYMYDLIESMSGSKLTEKQREAWKFMLAEDDDKEIHRRLRAFYRSGEAGKRKEKIPTPGDLIEQPESKHTAAALAWATVRGAISQYGSYRSVRFEDPRINAAVKALGGWPAVCDFPTEEMGFKAREFEALWNSGRESLAHCPGRQEIGNQGTENAPALEVTMVPVLGSMPDGYDALPEATVEVAK